MKPTMTFAFDVLWRCVRSLTRRAVHATVDGFRSVVSFDGQLYQIDVKPLYEFDEERFEDRKCLHDQGVAND